MKAVIQHDIRDCGAACLAMIAAHYGFMQPISYFRELTKTDQSGTTIYGIIDAADTIGLKAEALSGTKDEFMTGIREHRFGFPFIAHIITGNNLQHFVVVNGVNKKGFIVMDPARGKVKMDFSRFFEAWTGYMISFETTEHFIKKKSTENMLLFFSRLLTGQYRRLALILLLSIAISMIGIMGAFTFQFAMEHIEEKSISVIFLALIGMYALSIFIQYARGRMIIAVSRKIDLRLTISYFGHIMDIPVSSAVMRQTGDYLSRFSDASTIRNAISTTVLTLILDMLMVIGCGIILFLQNHRLFLISTVLMIAYAMLVMLYRGKLSESNRRYMEMNAVVQSYLKESIDGIETIKAAGAEGQIKVKMSEKLNGFLDAIVRKSLITVSQEAFVSAIESIGIAVVLWSGFSMVQAGMFSVGSLITFYILLGYFVEPVKNLIGLQPILQSVKIAAERLNDILKIKTEQCNMDGIVFPAVENWLVSKVDFRYGNNELTLEDISLSVNRGEKIAIVGESGCGKTTLAKLFLRFYDPEEGNISADGIEISKYELTSLRKNIAYVDQNTFLFAGTIRENLMVGNVGISQKDIMDACMVSGAYEFIQKLPMGLDTLLEENGSNLSGGQKQRLAIARALLKNPQLLILDEATSNLDTITEAGIKNSIFNINQKLTCIIIAHRLSTIKNCDRIYVMDNGHIIEYGTHDELINSNFPHRFGVLNPEKSIF